MGYRSRSQRAFLQTVGGGRSIRAKGFLVEHAAILAFWCSALRARDVGAVPGSLQRSENPSPASTGEAREAERLAPAC